jgi:hypothetical protein
MLRSSSSKALLRLTASSVVTLQIASRVDSRRGRRRRFGDSDRDSAELFPSHLSIHVGYCEVTRLSDGLHVRMYSTLIRVKDIRSQVRNIIK